MTVLEDVIRLYERGFCVIPLHAPGMGMPPSGNPKDAGKTPLVKWDPYKAKRPSEADLQKWWGQPWEGTGHYANVGLVCGKVSGVFAIDADSAAGLAFLHNRGLTIVHTLTSKTGRDEEVGHHLIFLHPGFDVKNGVGIVEGLDVRGDGGYIVVPPSMHRTGRPYEWLDAGMHPAPAPEWLLDMIRRLSSGRGDVLTRDAIMGLLKGVGQGGRHGAFAKLVGHWIALGLPHKEVLMQALNWNRANTPPQPENEVRAQVADFWRRYGEMKRDPQKANVSRKGDDYVFEWPDIGIIVGVSHLHEDYHGLQGEVEIKTNTGKMLHWGRLILASTSNRNDLDRKLSAVRSDIKWALFLDQIAQTVTTQWRQGYPTIVLEPTSEPVAADFIAGFMPAKETTVLFADGGSGKLLDINTPIPTPDGWTRMGDLSIGDWVFDDKGHPCAVLAIHDEIPERAYRLTFSDDTHIDAGGEHLWLTHDHQARMATYRGRRRGNVSGRKLPARQTAHPEIGPKVRTTDEIASTLQSRKRGDLNHSIPVCGHLDLPEVDLPIDPYVLGVWLGDGTSASAQITSTDKEIVEAVAAFGYPIRKQSSPHRHGVGNLQSALRSNGLLNNKHVPSAYMRASSSQRLALLQGLMDTDGYVAGSRVEIALTNKRLAVAVVELARSLGQKPVMRERRAILRGKDCGPCYRIGWRPTVQVFRLERKAASVRPQGLQAARNGHRMIVAADRIPPVPMRCIRVSSQSRLFLAGEGMIPTHNSTLAVALAVSVALGVPLVEQNAFLPRSLAPLRPGAVLYCDWESTPEEHQDRLAALYRGRFGGEVTRNIFYKRMSRPLWEEANTLKAEVARIAPGGRVEDVLVVVDSYNHAAGQDPESPDSAVRTMTALNSLWPATRLLLAHISKAGSERRTGALKPFGSVAVPNAARSAWEMRLDADDDTTNSDPFIMIYLQHRKVNRGRKQKPFVLRFDYREEANAQGGMDLKAIEIAARPEEDLRFITTEKNVAVRIMRSLMSEGPATYDELAERIDAKVNTVRGTVRRLYNAGKVQEVGRAGNRRIYGATAKGVEEPPGK